MSAKEMSVAERTDLRRKTNMGATAGSIRAGRAFVELFADDSKMQAVLKRAQVRLLSFSDFIRTVGLRMSALGIVMTVPFVKATDTYSKFSDAMLVVKAVTSATEKEFAILTTRARTLGQTTSFAAISVADLMGELGRAGFAAAEVDRMTASVLNLARASNTDATLSAKILASTIRQFERDAGDAALVADLLAGTANKSATSVDSLGQSLEYAGTIAHQMGMSLQRTLAIIGTLGNLGILGTESGTTIRRLSTLTAAEADEMRRIFKVSFKDARGNALPLVDVLEQIDKATAKLGSADRMQKYHEAFGLLGIVGAVSVGKAAGSVRQLEKELDNVGGYAAKAARTMDSEIGGTLRFARSAFADIGLSIGKALESDVVPIIQNITRMFRNLSAFIQENPKQIVQIAKGAVGIAAVGSALMGLSVAGGITALNLRGIGYALHFALTPARMLSDALGGVLSIAYRAEKLGTSWAGMLMSNVGFGGRKRGSRDGKIRKSDVGKSIETVGRRRRASRPAFGGGLGQFGGGVSSVARASLTPAVLGVRAVASGLAPLAIAPFQMAARLVPSIGSSIGTMLPVLRSGPVVGLNLVLDAAMGASRGILELAKQLPSLSVASAKALPGLSKGLLGILGGASKVGFGALVGGVTMLLNPMTLLLGAGIAVVANWDRIKGAITGVVSTAPGALSSMWNRIKSDALPTLLGIKQTALTAFGGISEAIQAGDITGAMQILWAGIRGIWTEGFGYLRLKWFDLTTWAGDAFNGVLQMAATTAGSISNWFDARLFDWFGVRLNDVTGVFSQAWGWIGEKSSAIAEWVSTQWNNVFGGMGEAGQSLSDIIWNSFEWMRKKIAQTILLMLNAAQTIADLDPTGLTSKMLGLSGFNIEDARKSLDDQFADRDRQRKKVATGDDPAMQKRLADAKKKVEDLEEQRENNALAARADRAQIEEDLRVKLELEKANLAAVIDETKQKRELREAAEGAANASRDEAPVKSPAPTGPTMPNGLTNQQQRSWMLKEQIRQRQAAIAAKKDAVAQKKAEELAARREKREKLADQQQRRAAGGLIPNRELFLQQGPSFFDDGEEDQHQQTVQRAFEMKARQQALKDRVPDFADLRMPGRPAPKGIGEGQPVKVDQSQVTAKIEQTNGYMVTLIKAVGELKGIFTA